MKTSPHTTQPGSSATSGGSDSSGTSGMSGGAKRPPHDAKSQRDNATADHVSGNPRAAQHTTGLSSGKSDKQRRELWMYLAVSIAAIELFIFVAALFFAFITSGDGQLNFPWLSWAAIAVGAPSVLLVSVHLAVGLFASSSQGDEEWQRHLPERLQKAYTFIKRAPAMVLLLSLIAIGVTLFTIDGAFQLLESFLVLFKPYILHILVGVGVVIVLLGLGAFWLNYRTRKLYADYEYRRAVLEKTGLIIVDKNSFILSNDQTALTPIAAESAKALPQGEMPSPEASGTSPATPPTNSSIDSPIGSPKDSPKDAPAPPAGASSGTVAATTSGTVAGTASSTVTGTVTGTAPSTIAEPSAETSTGKSVGTSGNTAGTSGNTSGSTSVSTSGKTSAGTPTFHTAASAASKSADSATPTHRSAADDDTDDITDAVFTEVPPQQ